MRSTEFDARARSLHDKGAKKEARNDFLGSCITYPSLTMVKEIDIYLSTVKIPDSSYLVALWLTKQFDFGSQGFQ